MRCSACNEPISYNAETAHGPDGEIHLACFKRGQGHGEEISLMTVYEAMGQLKKRVQDLERSTEHHARNIPFRIGGS